MIPKLIHYCWFSGEPFDETTKKCIESWEKYCPDYEIRECNTLNFDTEINDFVKEAFKSRKWAFVADYARLYLLQKYGGIYLDGDVELKRNLDGFLDKPAFIGQERAGWISAGLIGAEQNNDFINICLEYYKDRHFINSDKSLNQITNVQIITHNIFESYGCILDGSYRKVGNILHIYPVDYFSPKDSLTGEILQTGNTYAIHHFNNGWKDTDKKTTKNRKKTSLCKGKILISLVNGLANDFKNSNRKKDFIIKTIKTTKIAFIKRLIIRLSKSIKRDLYK